MAATPTNKDPPRLPTWAEMDDRASRALLEGLKELREEERKREEWRRLVEAFEWLEDHCWVLPEKERAPKPSKLRAPEPSKLTDKQMRQAIQLGTKLAEEEALYMLAMKAKQVAELDRQRPRLVWDRDQIEPRQV